MHNEITDDTGKVISLAEVSDYNIIYVGGLSPNLTYGKSFYIKIYNSMYVSDKYFYIINDSGDMVGKRE
jgi:hypothetical protein